MQFRKAILMGCEVAQQVPRKPDNLSLSPGTQIKVEGANQPHKIAFPPLRACCGPCDCQPL